MSEFQPAAPPASKTCPECRGSGRRFLHAGFGPAGDCEACDGTGRIPSTALPPAQETPAAINLAIDALDEALDIWKPPPGANDPGDEI